MYKKIIQNGDTIEVYEYEKDPPEYRQRKKSRYKNTRRRAKNVSRAHASLFRLVQANMGPNKIPAFLTLTMRDIVSLRAGWGAFQKFTHKLRRVAPGPISYIAVPEFQKRGAVHFHCLVWGCEFFNPCEISNIFYVDKTGKKHRKHICDVAYNCERKSRRIAELWGAGFADLFKSDGDERLAGYLAKYLSKAMHDIRYTGEKSYSASRSLLRSVHLKTQEAIYYVEAEIAGSRIQADGSIIEGVDKPLAPKKERTYSTKWMGLCNYKVYKFGEEI